jgi:hypothetical protein
VDGTCPELYTVMSCGIFIVETSGLLSANDLVTLVAEQYRIGSRKQWHIHN